MKCRICQNTGGNQEYEVKEMMYGYRDIHLYFQCSKCQCLQINKIPISMRKYYDDSYYSYSLPLTQKTNIMKRLLMRARNKYALFNHGLFGKILYYKYPTARFNFLRPIRKKISLDSIILDIGCGSGNFLQLLRNTGFTNLHGIDPFIDNNIKRDESGLTIKKKYIQQIQGYYNVIMFNHSFEHIPEPIVTLQKAFDLLLPGGYCIIRIPIVPSYAWNNYGVHWVQLDAPRHYFLHSIKSMEIISNKVGFVLYDVIYDSTAFQFWGSEQYAKDIPLQDDRSYGINPHNSIFTDEDIASFVNQANELNSAKQGDQATFYLQKP